MFPWQSFHIVIHLFLNFKIIILLSLNLTFWRGMFSLEIDCLFCQCWSSIFQSVEEIKPLSLSRERDCWEWQWLFRDVDDADGGANISNGTFPGENDVQGEVESLGSKITFSFVVLSFASSFVLRLLSCVDIWQLIKTDLFHSGSPSDWWWSLGGHRRVGGGGALGGVTS